MKALLIPALAIGFIEAGCLNNPAPSNDNGAAGATVTPSHVDATGGATGAAGAGGGIGGQSGGAGQGGAAGAAPGGAGGTVGTGGAGGTVVPVPVHLRVMPLGDSVTAGNLAGSSYRAPLLASLNAHPEALAVEFVGTQATYGPCCHEGHPGISIQVAALYLPGWLTAARPDVVLVLLGTNNQDPAAVPAYMSGIVDPILAHPGIKLVAAPLIYWASGDAQRRAFNAALVPALKAHPAFGSRLFVADAMADAVAPGADYDQPTGVNDGVHPGPIGNAKMATVWLNALRSAGVLDGLGHVANADGGI